MPIAVGTSQELPHSWGDKQKGAWDQTKKKKKREGEKGQLLR